VAISKIANNAGTSSTPVKLASTILPNTVVPSTSARRHRTVAGLHAFLGGLTRWDMFLNYPLAGKFEDQDRVVGR